MKKKKQRGRAGSCTHLDTLDCGFTGTQRPRQEDWCIGICSPDMKPYPMEAT